MLMYIYVDHEGPLLVDTNYQNVSIRLSQMTFTVDHVVIWVVVRSQFIFSGNHAW